ncbi:nuclear transport factor 2 family protein [Actinotalea sp. M2MS4P-6]|uniref:nuclear transport factor 2 family protein n=1 Tax=Actinotalea sp. M2MS4P-6 TaxID=2983762 RepID=UPI0021E3F3B7|nr:nuclear transport factor 2 family protein [Actinotalea sp. M2MS4P-6]MCV2394554.1 nuclear transport factor 2 family protein [Actinotalea sp. M2MS4P-6]
MVVGLVVGLGVTGCSGTAPEPTSTATSPVETPSETATVDPTEDAEAEVLAAYRAYWAATVALFAGNHDAAVYDGVAQGAIVEENLSQARYYEEYDLVLTGAPTFSNETVTIDGDRATVLACVDNSAWVPAEGEVTGEIEPVQAGGLVLERIDGTWLATDSTPAPEGFTC